MLPYCFSNLEKVEPSDDDSSNDEAEILEGEDDILMKDIDEILNIKSLHGTRQTQTIRHSEIRNRRTEETGRAAEFKEMMPIMH